MNIITNKRLFLTGLMLTLCVASAKEKVAASVPPSSTNCMGGMGDGKSMMEMMGKSKMNCMAASDTLGMLLKTAQEARKSEDKTKMKAALDLAEHHISAMNGNLGQCMNMMDKMGMMMGENGMMGMDQSKSDSSGMVGSKAKGSKAEAAEHEKHHSK